MALGGPFVTRKTSSPNLLLRPIDGSGISDRFHSPALGTLKGQGKDGEK
jgi:hypothetical protein